MMFTNFPQIKFPAVLRPRLLKFPVMIKFSVRNVNGLRSKLELPVQHLQQFPRLDSFGSAVESVEFLVCKCHAQDHVQRLLSAMSNECENLNLFKLNKSVPSIVKRDS